MSRLSGLKSAFTTAKWVLFAAILYFFVLPLIPGFRKAVSDLTQIKPSLLVLGLGLEFAALFSYSLLTKAALAEHGNEISVLRLFRIQLSTKAVGNVLPGGSAASTALGYRMLTLSGVAGPDAGFALATAGLGSAVMLNVILWFGLIVSAGRGVNAAYGTAAIIGIILMLIAAALIIGLIDGQGRAERFIRLCARKLRMDEDHAAEVLEHLGNRLQGLASEPKLLTRVLVWALVNWLLDMLANKRVVVISGAGDRRDQDIRDQTQILGKAFDEVLLYQDACQRGREDGEVIGLLREGLQGALRTTHVQDIQGEFNAIDTALSRLSPGDLCLILIDQVEEALAYITEKVKASQVG